MTLERPGDDREILDEWMTMRQAALELMLTRTRVTQLIRAGTIRAVKVDRVWLLRRADVLAYKERRKGPGRRPEGDTD